MIKIGIMTFSLADNAGAMLQLYSLYSYLAKESNAQVICLKYKNKNTYQYQHPFFIFKNELKTKTLFKNSNLRYCIFNHLKFNFFRTKMKYSKTISSFKNRKLIKLDIAIFGSDQILNFKLTNYDINYISGLNIIDAKKRIIFSGSMGSYKPIAPSDYELFRKAFQQLTSLSFRENDLCLFFKDCLNINSLQTCDPTFLLGADFWKTLVKKQKSKEFIFLYYATENLLKEATDYAEKNNKIIYYAYPLIQIPREKRFKKVHDDPKNFISYIYYSDYVFTSSYHCLVFSLIFNKKIFCPIESSNRFLRLKELISFVGCLDKISNIQIEQQQYNIYEKLENNILKSQEYLLNQIAYEDFKNSAKDRKKDL